VYNENARENTAFSLAVTVFVTVFSSWLDTAVSGNESVMVGG
jgi:hypothetical protein